MSTKVRKIEVDGEVKVFYREAGNAANPAILLLHGYPTTSHMYRNLIPLLAPHFYVVAPDLPGFGFTDVPDNYVYTFDNLANTIHSFTKKINLKKFVIYIFDYGSPIGFRLALKDSSSITGIVSQNGNAYLEGIDDRFWGPIKQYWATGNQKDPKWSKALIEAIEDPSNIINQYLEGVKDIEQVDPLAYELDIALFKRPGTPAVQLELFYDYKKNIEKYPQFQEYLRTSKVPVLLVWGKNDIIFNVAGADAFKKDVKNLRISNVDSGHFALETHLDEIAQEIIGFVLKLGIDTKL